jgi:hypothetical protein
MKSAQYAGFIDASSGRFVKPGIAAKEETRHQNANDGKKRGGSGGGNENPPDIDRSLRAFLNAFPSLEMCGRNRSENYGCNFSKAASS